LSIGDDETSEHNNLETTVDEESNSSTGDYVFRIVFLTDR